jgi:hypothetical protein
MITPGYKLRRDLMGDGDRLDTIEGDDDDEEYNHDANKGGAATDKIEVNLDDVQDDDDNESLLGSKNNTGLLAGPSSGVPGLFQIKESTDRGLADMETGSEVYMSELLVNTFSNYIGWL